MKFNLKVWRQRNAQTEGKLVDYTIDNINADMSFLEMVDVLNDMLILKGEDPIAFDHDCREGICGMCSMYINGRAHGPQHGAATCFSYTCARLKMATPLAWNPGEPKPFRW